MHAITTPLPTRSVSPFATLSMIDAEGRRRDPLMWGFALVLLLSMAPMAVAYAIDDRLVNDINVWTKPLKFASSLALYFGTMAWFMAYLPKERSRFIDRFALVSVALVVFEMVYITAQSGRGVGSHFNIATPVEGLMFALMGAAALVFTSLPMALGIGIARSRDNGLAPAFKLAVVLGLVLTTVLGAGAGIAISVNNGHWVGAPATDAGGFPIVGWTRAGGDLRVAHFFGIHAMQVLPVIGWLVARRSPQATGVVWAAAGAFTALTVYTLVEALLGRPFLPFIG